MKESRSTSSPLRSWHVDLSSLASVQLSRRSRFFEVICDISFDPVLYYFAFRRAQEVDWSVLSLGDPFFSYL